MQNGRNWVGIFRKVECGEILWTYTEAPPAFEVVGTDIGEVNENHCEMIARLIEHAYCTANHISRVIITPSLRPIRPRYLIKAENDKDNDNDDYEKGATDINEGNGGDPVNKRGRVTRDEDGKSSGGAGPSISGEYVHSRDYFLLPLTKDNVQRHTNGVHL